MSVWSLNSDIDGRYKTSVLREPFVFADLPAAPHSIGPQGGSPPGLNPRDAVADTLVNHVTAHSHPGRKLSLALGQRLKPSDRGTSGSRCVIHDLRLGVTRGTFQAKYMSPPKPLTCPIRPHRAWRGEAVRIRTDHEQAFPPAPRRPHCAAPKRDQHGGETSTP